VGLAAAPAAIASIDEANSFVDEIVDSDQEGDKEKDKKDSGDANAAPNFWLGLINTGPVSFEKPVDDPVTSGSDSFGLGPVAPK
jgi:hypothetical protein